MSVTQSLSKFKVANGQQIENKTLMAQNKDEPLLALSNYLAEDMAACNRTIMERMQSPVDLIPRLAAHLIIAGGKRLRPLLTLASARLCGYQPTEQKQGHVLLAACVEFIHTATLLHDDVVDESQLRRGSASANMIFGNQASVLVGDFLFSRSFQLMTESGSLEVMRILSQASATIAEGEVLQMTTQNDLSTPISRYLEVVNGKTAALFAAACRVGAVLAESSEEDGMALESYGHNLGMAFQLVDDALDYSADQATLGKTIGDDFREGKITLPVLTAYTNANSEEKQFWVRVIEKGEQKSGDLEYALQLIEKNNAIEITLDKAANFIQKACQALKRFPEGELHHLMEEVAVYTLNRLR